MVCLRESLPEVREQIQNLADKLGVDYGTAKIILLENNGYDLDKAPSGAESKLYLTLLEHYNGDERKALIAKAKTYLQPFFDWFGDWIDPDTTDVSKVVDENGEPLIVYHHTNNENLNEFSTEFDNYFAKDGGTKKAIFFDENTTGTLNRQYDLPVFLNIRELTTYVGTKEDLHKQGTTYREVVNKSAENNDTTGGLHMAEFDDNRMENQSIWIIHDSNQVKSIDNQGTFSTTDNNINRNRQKQKAPPSDLGLKKRLFNDKDETSIGTMLTRLKKDNPQFTPLIFAIQNGLSIKTKSWKIKLIDFEKSIDLSEQERASSAFYRYHDHTIYIDVKAAFPIQGSKFGKADMTLLHEILHAVTHEAITNNKQLRAELVEMLHNARKAMIKKYGQSLEQLLDSEKNQNKFYGLTDVDEFLSEAMTNSFFARELIQIKSVKEVKTAWDKFLEWIMKVFGVTEQNNAYSEVYSKLQDIIQNYQSYNDSLEGLPVLSAADAEYEAYLLAVYGSSATRSVNTKKPTVDDLVKKYRQLSDDIEFIKEQDGAEVHIYKNRKTGQIYKSVSDVKTDVGYGEQEDKLPENAVELGNFTKVRGTLMHEALSDILTGNFDVKNYKQLPSKVIKQLQNIAKNILKDYTIIASEQVLADDTTGIAGTADLIVQDKKTKKIIILDFKTKIKNLGDQKKSGFNYYHSSKFGKPDVEKHNFQLSMYEKMHNLYGFKIDERGIIPIEYDTDNNGNIINVYLSPNSKGTTLENKGYYTIPHRSQIDQDIEQYVFNQNPDGAMDKIQLDRQSEIVGKILDTLKNKVVTLYSKGRTTQATDIENTVNEFNSLGEQEIILGYIKTALDNLKNIIDGKKGYNEHLQRERTEGNTVWNLKQLENWRDVARSFKPLEEIQQYLFDYQDILPEGTYEQIMPILDEAIRYRDILEGAYKTKGKALWIEWIKPFITNIEASYRLQAEREYKKTHSKVDNQEMQAYIEKYIANNRTKIEIETKNFINQQSQLADSDVNGFYRWVDTIFQSKDPIVAGMALAYDQMKQQTNETYNIKYKKLVDLTREMEEAFGSSIFSDPKKVYDYMLELDDDVRLIDEIPISFTHAYKQMVGEIESDTQYTSNFERFKAKMQWLDKNAPISDKSALKKAKIKAVEDYLNSLDITDEEYDAIIANESKKGRQRKSYYELAKEGTISYKRADDLREISEQVTWKFRKPDSKLYKNEKFEALQKLRQKDPNDIRVRFYDFIKELSAEGDSKVAPRYKLNGRIPGMSKTSVERLSAGQSIWQVVKELTSKAFQLKADDTMYGQFEMTDEQNKPINFIPVFFTNKLNLSDQSYDLPTIYKEWFKSALNYANTNEIIDQLEFTRFIVNERRTKTGGLSFASKAWKRLNPDSQISETWSTKDSSNLANQLNDWFDQVVYGKSTDPMGSLDLPIVGKVDTGKVVDLFTKYTSLRVMGLNYISMVNNMAMAEVAQAIETMSHLYVSAKSYSKATAEYTTELLNGHIVADVGARKPTSKINLLNELFGTFSDFDNGRMRLSNRFSRLFNSGAFYFTTNIGEHEAQSRFLIASLMEQRALDSNGNDIGSIYDFYTVEDGELVFDKEGKVANWDDNKRRQVSARIRSQLMSMHGNYSPEWKVALQRNGYLKLALMFRKWIVPSWRKRWDTMYYDNVMQTYKEGYYRTGGAYASNMVKRFFYKLTDESKAAEIAITTDWNNLTELERLNIKRFGTEVSIFVTLCILYSILKNWADDEDSVFIDNFAYQAYRLRTDMGFYVNPRDMMKIILSPFPSTSAVKSVANLFDSVLHPLDKYERGPWKDHYKIEKRVYDMMPVVRQLYRARDIENEYNILNMK